jgi:hypothetical protein
MYLLYKKNTTNMYYINTIYYLYYLLCRGRDNGTSPGGKVLKEMSAYVPCGCAQTIWLCSRPKKRKWHHLPNNSHNYEQPTTPPSLHSLLSPPTTPAPSSSETPPPQLDDRKVGPNDELVVVWVPGMVLFLTSIN